MKRTTPIRPASIDIDSDPGLSTFSPKVTQPVILPTGTTTTGTATTESHSVQIIKNIYTVNPPGGANGEVQFNFGGSYTGDGGLTYVPSTDTLTTGTLNVTQLNPSRINISSISNLTIGGGSYNNVLKTDGAGALSWASAFPSDAGNTGKFLKSNGINQEWANVSYANLVDVPSNIATQSYVSNAIANLVDSSPAALNTLNELANALGNNASFSTTITNQLANKASVTSVTDLGNIVANISVDTGNITFSDTTMTSNNGDVKIHFTPTASPAVEFNFASNGTLTLPGGIVIQNNEVKNTGTLSGEVQITTATTQGDIEKNWTFNHNGTGALIVPEGSSVQSKSNFNITATETGFIKFTNIVDFDTNSTVDDNQISIVNPEASILDLIDSTSANYVGGLGSVVRIVYGPFRSAVGEIIQAFADPGTPDPLTGLPRYQGRIDIINPSNGDLLKEFSIEHSSTWKFGSDGNITLPSNTSKINYANGTNILSGSGAGIALTDISIGTPNTANGGGNISYANSTGVFTYTPPNLAGYLTSITNIFDQELNTTDSPRFDDIEIHGNIIANSSIDVYSINGGEIDIYTDWDSGNGVEVWLKHDDGIHLTTQNGQFVWQFNRDGSLYLPTFTNDWTACTTPNLSGGITFATTSLDEGPHGTTRSATINLDRTSLSVNVSSSVWSFDTTGNITLPAGGDILDSTGNSVLGGQTFDQDLNTNNNVSFGSVTTGNIFNTANIEITTPYGTVADIDISTDWAGNGSSGGIDLWLKHSDGLYIKTHDGNNIWSFDDNGTLNFPTTSNVTSAAIAIDNANAEISMSTDTGNISISPGTSKWVFDTTGNITLPAGGDILDSTGTSVLGGSGSSYDQELNTSNNVTFNSVITSNIHAVNGSTAVIPSTPGTAGSPLTINAGTGGSAATSLNAGNGGNLTITAGDAGSDIGNPSWGAIGGTLVLKGGNSTQPYVGSNVEIRSGNSASTPGVISLHTGTNQWTFGNDGNLTVPGSLINDTSIVLSAPAVFNICTIATAGSGYNTGSALKATTGGSGTGMTVGIGYGLSNQLSSVTVVDPGTGYANGDVITVSEGTGGTFVITKYNQSANQTNNNTIQTDFTFANSTLTLPIYGEIATDTNMTLTTNLANTGNTRSWTFGADGTLTLPNGQAYIAVEGDGGVSIFEGEYAFDDIPKTSIKIGGTNDNYAFAIYSESDTPKTWRFVHDGSLTLPIGVSIDSSVDPLYPKIIADSGKLFSVQGQGNTGSAALAWSVDPNAASQYAAVSVSRGGGDDLAKVILQAQSDSSDVATAKTWKFNETGTLSYPNSALQQDTGLVTCAGGASTIVYIASADIQHTIKLLIQVEGLVGAETLPDTQSCEMIIAKSFRGNNVASTVYAIVHTSVAPLATFTALWDGIINRVEVICTPTGANAVDVKTFATEITAVVT